MVEETKNTYFLRFDWNKIIYDIEFHKSTAPPKIQMFSHAHVSVYYNIIITKLPLLYLSIYFRFLFISLVIVGNLLKRWKKIIMQFNSSYTFDCCDRLKTWKIIFYNAINKMKAFDDLSIYQNFRYVMKLSFILTEQNKKFTVHLSL